MKAVIVNDCTKFRHFGCILVMDAFRHELDRVGIELLGTVPCSGFAKSLDHPEHSKLCDKADLVIVNGEGSLHDDAHPYLLRVAERWPAILMNTVFQNNYLVQGLDKFLWRAARESLSANEMMHVGGVQCSIVPDVILMAPLFVETQWMPPWLSKTTTDSSAEPGAGDLVPQVPPSIFLYHLKRHRGVACGRFHAILACACAKVPFSAYPANTWKNEGLMNDMGLRHLYFKTMKEAKRRVPVISHFRAMKYITDARETLGAFFDEQIWEIAK